MVALGGKKNGVVVGWSVGEMEWWRGGEGNDKMIECENERMRE